MHKIFLTAPEVSFIVGADEIVEDLGGFPSMENSNLLSISVQNSGSDNQRYNVSLVFDIEKWAIESSRYVDIPTLKHKYILLCFFNVRQVDIHSPSMNVCGEFKFGNTTDRKKMYQDVLPSEPIVVNRPFCSFYMQSGQDFVLEFEDDTCTVFASFLNTPQYQVKNSPYLTEVDAT